MRSRQDGSTGDPLGRATPRPPQLRTLSRERWAQLVDLLAPFKRFLSPGPPLHRGEEARPVFIIGAPRSGNTLLRRVLLAHPDLHIPPENYSLRHCIRLYRQYRRLMRWEQLVELLLAEFRRPPLSDSWGLGNQRQLARRLEGLPPGRRSLAALIDGLYRAHAEGAGKPGARWGDKTPSNIFCLHRFPGVFPAAQYVFLVRDPADVAHSCMRHWGNTLENAAERWIYTLNSARCFARRRPESSLFLRYEDLVLRTEETIRYLAEFLGLQLTETTLSAMANSQRLAESMGDVPGASYHQNVAQEIQSRHIGKGRRYLSVEQKLALDSLLGGYAAAMGYERIIRR